MDIVLILVIVVVLGILGGVAVVAARGAGLWSAVALPGRASERRPRPSTPATEVGSDGLDIGDQAEAAIATPPAAEARDGRRDGLQAAIVGGDERLARLEERLGELVDGLAAHLDDLAREIAGDREAAAARRGVDEARQEAAL